MAPTGYFTSLPESIGVATSTGSPASPLFDPMPMSTQSFNPAAAVSVSNMMAHHHHHGGIIADDLQSLRSIASTTPEPDIEMADTPMLSAADFSSPYPHSGMHTPPPNDALGSPSMAHNGDAFYHHDEAHAF
jgi:hypothetical protein